MFTLLYMLLWIAVFAFGILCAAELLLSPVSDSARQSVRRRPLLHALGVCLALAPFLISYLPYWWPPLWLERSRQRSLVRAIIQTNGGWAAFLLEASRLIQFASTNDQRQWFPRFSDHLSDRQLPRAFRC